MKNFKNNRGLVRMPKSGGFIKMILVVVIALVLIKYVFDIDVVGYLTTGKFKDWLDKLYNLASNGWRDYIDVLVKAWNYFIEVIKKFTSQIK
jgi:hypothetical protein